MMKRSGRGKLLPVLAFIIFSVFVWAAMQAFTDTGFHNSGEKAESSSEISAVSGRTMNDTSETAETTVPSIEYQGHVQNIGWMDWVENGETSGTAGQALRLESLRIRLTDISGSVEYRSHVENIGWTDFVRDGAVTGTEGRFLRIEAIEIRLTGAAADLYDIYYRVHVEDLGWLGWGKNGGPAGTAGYGYRCEAVQIVLAEKGGSAPGPTERVFLEPGIRYQSHIQNIGWTDWVNNGETSGTTGRDLRLEAIRVSLVNVAGGIEYRTHVQDIGWTDYVTDGVTAGTEGLGLRTEAVEVRLTGDASERFDVYYRVHAQNFGWMDWACNGQPAGTAGFGLRTEAMEIVLVLKGGAAPGSTARPFAENKPVSRRGPMVALTFDDGPYATVDARILDLLSEYGGHATFFVAGYRIGEYPDTIRQICSQGSEIGNHTYSHTNLTKLSSSGIRDELSKTDQLIMDLTGKRPALIRPPEGSYNTTVINSIDRPLVLWSVDPSDWETRNASLTISRVLDHVQDGDIILLHSLYTSTVDACETIIPELAARGFQMVTVSELMEARGASFDAGSVIRCVRP